MEKFNSYKSKILSLGASRVEQVLVKDIVFSPELRQRCKANKCGNYGKNWTCPPHVEEIHTLIQDLKVYKTALIFQCVYSLDNMDTVQAKNNYRKFFNKVVHIFSATEPQAKLLSVAGCHICEQCGAITNKPCQFPSIAYSSLEAYGIKVSELARISNMNLKNGDNSITYFGAVFLN